MTQILLEYYNEHKLNFEKNYLLAKESLNTEAIHKMRTSMKRLRALYQLVQHLTEKQFNEKKQLKKGRKIFKLISGIRELQVEEMLVFEYEELLGLKFIDYSEYLMEKGHREIQFLKQELPDKLPKIFNDDALSNSLNSIEQKEIQYRTRGFIKQKSDTLLRINNKGKTTKRIHQNRTILKQIFYLYPILTKLSGWHLILGMKQEEMKEREQKIGMWHDSVNSLHYLNHFFMAKKGRDTEHYLKLKQKIAEDRDKMKSEIIKHIFKIQTSLWEGN